MQTAEAPRGLTSILKFWWPLALTWVLMALEGPVISALAARLPAPVENLAAWGIAFSISIFAEGPVIMLLAASVRLVQDRGSYLEFQRFALVLSTVMTIVLAALAHSPALHWLLGSVLAVPVALQPLVQDSLCVLAAAPAVVGYRRFYQGVSIGLGAPRTVGFGAVLRITTISVVGVALFISAPLPGAVVGAITLVAAMTVEAAAARLFAAPLLHRLRVIEARAPLGLRQILRFYLPLSGAAVLSLGLHPLTALFVARGPLPVQSLAVIAVINGLTFVFKAVGISYQEVVVALLRESSLHLGELRRIMFAGSVMLSVALITIAFTPLGPLVFSSLFGVSVELIPLSITCLKIVSLIGGLTMLLTWQRSVLVAATYTSPVLAATVIEVVSTAGLLWGLIQIFALPGAIAAACATTSGRLLAVLALIVPTRSGVKRIGEPAAS